MASSRGRHVTIYTCLELREVCTVCTVCSGGWAGTGHKGAPDSGRGVVGPDRDETGWSKRAQPQQSVHWLGGPRKKSAQAFESKGSASPGLRSVSDQIIPGSCPEEGTVGGNSSDSGQMQANVPGCLAGARDALCRGSELPNLNPAMGPNES